jgi:hypothetical protein
VNVPEEQIKGRGIALPLVLAVAAPPALISIFWTTVSLLHHSGASPRSAFPAFALAIAAGAWPLLKLPLRSPYRFLCLLAYVPLAYAALFFYSLLFLGLVLRVGLDHGS